MASSYSRLVGVAARTTARVFARPVTYWCRGEAVAIEAVFHAAHETVDASGTVPVSTTRPTLFVRADLLPALAGSGDVVEIGEATYTVADLQPDGHGGYRIPLYSGHTDLGRW